MHSVLYYKALEYAYVEWVAKLGKLACLGKLAFAHHEERVAGDPRVTLAVFWKPSSYANSERVICLESSKTAA
jgi:hypothetical protein